MHYRFHAPVLGYPRNALVAADDLAHVDPDDLAALVASDMITEEHVKEPAHTKTSKPAKPAGDTVAPVE